MKRVPLSAVVTTRDNARTLARCLASAAFADELLVLDSGSVDATPAIAHRFGAQFLVEPFKGYGPQKQSAIAQARHDWVLLLDADEALTDEAVAQIREVLVEPRATGYELPRCERMFWQWQHSASKHNFHLRLFDRRVHRMGDDPVHAAPRRDVGIVHRLGAPFRHDGEHTIASKVARINNYSSGVAATRAARRSLLALHVRLVFYPPLVLVKHWLIKRQFMNGWAGWIASVSHAYYAFLKDAKALEHIINTRDSGSIACRFTQQAQGDPADGRSDQHEHRP